MDGRSHLERGLTVMENMVPSSTLSEIAARSRLPRSTAHRIVHDLRCHGWLVQNPDSTYSPGWRWRSVIGEIRPLPELRVATLSELRHLVDVTGWTALFVLHNGGIPRVGASLAPEHADIPPAKGTVLDARNTAEAIIMKAMVGGTARSGLPPVVDDDEDKVLSRARRRGFAVTRTRIGSAHGDITAVRIAAAIMDRDSAPLGALVIYSAGGELSETSARAGLGELLPAAQRQSASFSDPRDALGSSPPVLARVGV